STPLPCGRAQALFLGPSRAKSGRRRSWAEHDRPMPDIPDPLLLPLGALLTSALAAIIGGGYMLLCENRPLLARRMESLMPALGTLVCAAAIVATIGGGDGWMLAGLTAPLLYAVQSYLWIGVLRQEAALAEEAAFRRKALGDLAEPL